MASAACAALVARVEEPVHQELELELAQAVVVEGLLHLGQAARLEHVLQIGVPDAEAGEPDLPASAQRSAQPKRLHSRPTWTSTGPETVQYRPTSSTSRLGELMAACNSSWSANRLGRARCIARTLPSRCDRPGLSQGSARLSRHRSDCWNRGIR